MNDAQLKAYTQGYTEKLAGAGQHLINAYEQMTDKDLNVVGQTAVGAGAGAGLGGTLSAIGQRITPGLKPNTFKGMLSTLGRHPMLSTAIPAGVLALVAGIRAKLHNR